MFITNQKKKMINIDRIREIDPECTDGGKACIYADEILLGVYDSEKRMYEVATLIAGALENGKRLYTMPDQ